MGETSFLSFLEMEQDAAIRQRHFADGDEVAGERVAEKGLGEVGIDVVAPAEQLLELHIGWEAPTRGSGARGEVAAQACDAVHRDLAVQQKMMDDCEHHHSIEVARAAAQEGSRLAVLPARRRSRIRKIDA